MGSVWLSDLNIVQDASLVAHDEFDKFNLATVELPFLNITVIKLIHGGIDVYFSRAFLITTFLSSGSFNCPKKASSSSFLTTPSPFKSNCDYKTV